MGMSKNENEARIYTGVENQQEYSYTPQVHTTLP